MTAKADERPEQKDSERKHADMDSYFYAFNLRGLGYENTLPF